MPVAQGSRAPARQAFLLGLGALMAVLSVLFLVTQMDRLFGSVDNVQFEIGDQTFRPGKVDQLANDIEAQGPLFLPDLANGDRDIWLQHTGDDETDGWNAFSARPLASPRDCYVEWRAEDELFVDNCDGTEYPADGEGLPQYPVSVDADDNLSVLLGDAPTVDGD